AAIVGAVELGRVFLVELELDADLVGMLLVELGGWSVGGDRRRAELAGMLLVELELGGRSPRRRRHSCAEARPATARQRCRNNLGPEHRVSTNLKSIFTPLPLPRGCHATRDVAGWGDMKRDPASGASLRGHCRIARWLTISACAGKGSNPFSRSL
ncbi:MAG: hypothetical protein ACREU5_09515, partial [Burkholderiales bacterium]